MAMTALEDYLIEELAPQYDLDAAWTPDSIDKANWLARKVKRAQQSIADLAEQRDLEIARTEAWFVEERARHDQTVAWASGLLEVWLRTEIAADDSKRPRKSRSLPCGVTVKVTTGGESLTVDDEPALVEWLKAESPEVVEFVAKYSKADVKRLLTKDGLKVPGVSLVRGEDGFKVEVTP